MDGDEPVAARETFDAVFSLLCIVSYTEGSAALLAAYIEG